MSGETKGDAKLHCGVHGDRGRGVREVRMNVLRAGCRKPPGRADRRRRLAGNFSRSAMLMVSPGEIASPDRGQERADRADRMRQKFDDRRAHRRAVAGAVDDDVSAFQIRKLAAIPALSDRSNSPSAHSIRAGAAREPRDRQTSRSGRGTDSRCKPAVRASHLLDRTRSCGAFVLDQCCTCTAGARGAILEHPEELRKFSEDDEESVQRSHHGMSSRCERLDSAILSVSSG